MSKSFEERMKELEDGYNRMPDSISPDQIIQGVEQKSKKKSYWKRIYTFGGGILAAGIATLLVMSQPGMAPGSGNSNSEPGSDSDGQAPSAETEEDPAEETEEEETPELTEEKAFQLMADYEESFTSLINETDSQKVESYQTTDEVRQHFEGVMSEDLASWMTDSYFREEADGVYVIAKDAPTWLQEDQPFELEEESEGHVRIVQERNNNLLGHVEMIYHAAYVDGQWMVDEIETNELEDSNSPGDNADGHQQEVAEAAQSVVDYLVSQDMPRLAELVHPEKGVLFSPYVHVEEDDAQVLQAGEIENFFQDEEQYVWGTQDGSGRTIEMTPSEYYEEYIYEADLSDPDEINVEEIEERSTMTNNIKDVFPEATVVEYYIEGSGENAEMSWSALNIVMEQDENGEWKVVAIVHDEWTI
ncbi:hypothetical protein [Salibacterium aidingense]|uniref:hypothetical protein n=1 Tax=Salibacterium aidingense TaxID=384933 RepID=UPI00040850D1|nr:hypothetical protein [Salibacterium aidingense]